VPVLKDKIDDDGKPHSLRERMEEHRSNPGCAACHKVMDPIGFALENFDAVGAWRTRDGGMPIDVSGQLADGTPVNGVVTLRAALLARPEIFVGTMTEKMLTYALGRGLTPDDMPVVRSVVRQSAAQDHRFSSLVQGIVNSVPFQMRRRCWLIRELVCGRIQFTNSPIRQFTNYSGGSCSLPRSPCRGEPSCVAWARRSRCRCSTRWYRR
jgi:hypothetical protein